MTALTVTHRRIPRWAVAVVGATAWLVIAVFPVRESREA